MAKIIGHKIDDATFRGGGYSPLGLTQQGTASVPESKPSQIAGKAAEHLGNLSKLAGAHYASVDKEQVTLAMTSVHDAMVNAKNQALDGDPAHAVENFRASFEQMMPPILEGLSANATATITNYGKQQYTDIGDIVLAGAARKQVANEKEAIINFGGAITDAMMDLIVSGDEAGVVAGIADMQRQHQEDLWPIYRDSIAYGTTKEGAENAFREAVSEENQKILATLIDEDNELYESIIEDLFKNRDIKGRSALKRAFSLQLANRRGRKQNDFVETLGALDSGIEGTESEGTSGEEYFAYVDVKSQVTRSDTFEDYGLNRATYTEQTAGALVGFVRTNRDNFESWEDVETLFNKVKGHKEFKGIGADEWEEIKDELGEVFTDRGAERVGEVDDMLHLFSDAGIEITPELLDEVLVDFMEGTFAEKEGELWSGLRPDQVRAQLTKNLWDKASTAVYAGDYNNRTYENLKKWYKANNVNNDYINEDIRRNNARKGETAQVFNAILRGVEEDVILPVIFDHRDRAAINIELNNLHKTNPELALEVSDRLFEAGNVLPFHKEQFAAIVSVAKTDGFTHITNYLRKMVDLNPSATLELGNGLWNNSSYDDNPKLKEVISWAAVFKHTDLLDKIAENVDASDFQNAASSYLDWYDLSTGSLTSFPTTGFWFKNITEGVKEDAPRELQKIVQERIHDARNIPGVFDISKRRTQTEMRYDSQIMALVLQGKFPDPIGVEEVYKYLTDPNSSFTADFINADKNLSTLRVPGGDGEAFGHTVTDRIFSAEYNDKIIFDAAHRDNIREEIVRDKGYLAMASADLALGNRFDDISPVGDKEDMQIYAPDTYVVGIEQIRDLGNPALNEMFMVGRDGEKEGWNWFNGEPVALIVTPVMAEQKGNMTYVLGVSFSNGETMGAERIAEQVFFQSSSTGEYTSVLSEGNILFPYQEEGARKRDTTDINNLIQVLDVLRVENRPGALMEEKRPATPNIDDIFFLLPEFSN